MAISFIVLLNIESIDGFMMLVKILDANQVYSKYRYYFQDDFLLLIEEYDDYSNNIKNEVNKHNEKVENLDFPMPGELELFILISGSVMKVSIHDFWMDDI